MAAVHLGVNFAHGPAAVVALGLRPRPQPRHQSPQAFDLLAEMEAARVLPDVASYTAAIGACSRGGNLPAALELLGMMRGTPPAAGRGGGSFSAWCLVLLSPPRRTHDARERV